MRTPAPPPTITLGLLSLAALDRVRAWRNLPTIRPTLRTPGYTTPEQQEQFYADVVNNPQSPHRYYALTAHGTFVGMGGLTYISWVNRIAEISLLIDPETVRMGYGRAAVQALLTEAWDTLGLFTVCGEAYLCNPSIEFWYKIAKAHDAVTCTLPRRKFWNGRLWDSFYFSFAHPLWGNL